MLVVVALDQEAQIPERVALAVLAVALLAVLLAQMVILLRLT
jgi:hypothetical protein